MIQGGWVEVAADGKLKPTPYKTYGSHEHVAPPLNCALQPLCGHLNGYLLGQDGHRQQSIVLLVPLSDTGHSIVNCRGFTRSQN